MAANMYSEEVPPAPVRSSRSSVVSYRILRQPQFWLGAAVLIPTLIWYIVFQFGPVLEAFGFSLVFVRLLHLFQSRYVGLSNFSQLFDPVLNPDIYPAITHTVIWTAFQFVVLLPVSLLLAICLAQVTRGRTLYQILLFMPVITPLVDVGLIMGRFFDPKVGLANRVLHAVGLPSSQWLYDPSIALLVAASIGAWRWLGLYTILFTAGIVTIPRDIGDAARVDGAGSWTMFRRITLPLLGHILVLVLILLLVNALQEYTLPTTLSTNLSPNPLLMMNQVLDNIAFGNLELGVGSAAAVLECIVTLVISLLILKLFRPRWSH